MGARQFSANQMISNPDHERFQSDAENYVAYLATPEGRLRIDLVHANLQEVFPGLPTKPALRCLDIGGGNGSMAILLAQRGIHITLLDSSRAMLDHARSAAERAGVSDDIEMKYADAGQLGKLFNAGSFDLVLCHNLLEYLDDPAPVLLGAARLLRDSSSIFSIVVRNQAGEVFKAAVKSGDLAAAQHALTAEQGTESLYGGSVRLFTAQGLHAALRAASLFPMECRGVRVLSDYLPEQISRMANYERIFELERKLSSRPDFAAVARYLHCFAHRADAAIEGGA